MRQRLNILAVILVALCATTVQAGAFVGYTQTKHLLTTGLNDYHPFIGYETESLGVMGYKNSFSRSAVAVYGRSTYAFSSNYTAELKYGVTTGYKQREEYDGKYYTRPDFLFINKDLSLLAVPSLNYHYDKMTYSYEQIGDAMGLTIKVNF